MIPISKKYEPLCEIPEQSLVVLESGDRVHYIGVIENEYTSRALPEAHVRNVDTGRTLDLPANTAARYVCSISDYEARATIA